MKEGISGVINIEDIDPDVFKDLLDFIYTGNAPNIEKNAQGLLFAADKEGTKHEKKKTWNGY